MIPNRHLIRRGAVVCVLAFCAGSPINQIKAAPAIPAVAPTIRCSDRQARDQDDLCIWVHPTDPAQGTLIASDKSAGQLFVYDLEGRTLQRLAARHPGNIDLRYGFLLGGRRVDIVAFNQREDPRIVVCQVDPDTRQLTRVDNGSLRTGENYGGTLYRSPKSGRCYFVATSKRGTVEQYELVDGGAGRVGARKVRAWQIGFAEAAVADDERGMLYVGEESKGVWAIGGEPDDPIPGQLVIRVGANGLDGDVEGLAIYHLPRGGGYLLVSNQKRSNFKVYQRTPPHAFLGTFAIRGARDTDGIDVCHASLGPRFSKGLFACHTDSGKRPVLLTPWDAIAMAVSPPLGIDTAWSER